MRLIEIYAWVITFTLIVAGVVLALIAAGGSRRKYEKFSGADLDQLDEFRKDESQRPR